MSKVKLEDDLTAKLADLLQATKNHGLAHLKPVNQHQAQMLSDALQVYLCKDDYYCAKGHEKDLGYPCETCAKET